MVLAKDLDVKFEKHILPTKTFTSFSAKRTYEIRPENLNCMSRNVLHSIFSKTCYKQCTAVSKEFRKRPNNYGCAHRNY